MPIDEQDYNIETEQSNLRHVPNGGILCI